jgi:succinate dehydrogenase cytochrome b subunit
VPPERTRPGEKLLAKAKERNRPRIRQFGRLYLGREGQWSWLLHRVTGVGIILFLFAHVVDTALVGWGPEAYNKVVAVYHNPFIRLLELALVGMVIYHALNGVRIMVIDFFPRMTVHHAKLFYAEMVLFIGSMIPITYIIGKPVVEAWF